jgi:hypothetical protein
MECPPVPCKAGDESVMRMPDPAETPALPEPRPLSDAARRALAEAEARQQARAAAQPTETGGRGGLDPARYGDWEIKGIACDF